jgi:hypothetical protein
MSSWRDRARPIVAQVLWETKDMDKKAIDKALFDAYPFGMRKYLPYKVWLDEIQRQRYGIVKKAKRRKGPTRWQVAQATHRLEEWEQIYGKRSER